LSKNREFSLYDIEEFLKEAGAERINEKAVVSLEKELEDTVKELIDEVTVYANYAGRKKLIKKDDIELVSRKRYVPSKKKLRIISRIEGEKRKLMMNL